MRVPLLLLLLTGSTVGVTLSPHNSYKNSDEPLKSGSVQSKYANASQYKFMAQIFYAPGGDTPGSFYQCGGALISSEYILSAASCIMKSNMLLEKERLKVIVGKVNLGESSGPEDRYNVTDIIYNGFPETPEADIALLKLSSPVPDAAATPIKIYDCPIKNNVDPILAGFGASETSSKEPSQRLVHTNLNIASNGSKSCKLYGSSWNNNQGPQICTESLTGNDACQGDTGSPLLYFRDGKLTLAGITSHGINKNPASPDACGIDGLSFFTSTGYYADWIERTIGVKKFKTSC